MAEGWKRRGAGIAVIALAILAFGIVLTLIIVWLRSPHGTPTQTSRPQSSSLMVPTFPNSPPAAWRT